MPNKPRRLLIATHNQGKLGELQSMLDGFDIALLSLRDFPDIAEVPESGSTFAENARLKASEYAAHTGLTALADDSGLVIDALNGRPGVLSARYGGTGTSFESKMAFVLNELDQTADTSRRAHFVSSMVIADAAGNILCQSEGICSGRIAAKPIGTGGFGYDPIFIPDGHELTFGQLDPAIKQEISHRSRAFRVIIPFLRDFVAN